MDTLLTILKVAGGMVVGGAIVYVWLIVTLSGYGRR